MSPRKKKIAEVVELAPLRKCDGLNRFGSKCARWALKTGPYCRNHEGQEAEQAAIRANAARPREKLPEMGRGRVAHIIRENDRWAEIKRRIDQGLTFGDLVKELTVDELIHGRLHGQTYSSKSWIPAEFHMACTRELLFRGEVLFREAFLDAVRTFATIAADVTVEPAQRLKAAQFIVERIGGKTPERIEVVERKPYEDLIATIVSDDGRRPKVIEG